jgi:hypothetical protein
MTYAEIEAVSGTSSQTGLSRWGDYSNISVDPVDDSTFWFTTEYMRGGWKTRIFSFNFDPLVPPVVSAGDDATVCQNTLFTTDGSTESAKSWEWSTSGDGIIATPTNLVTYYLGGPQDIANGQVTLTLTAQGYATGVQAEDDMTLFITKNPSVFAGNDTIINSASIFYTAAGGQNFDAVEWTTGGDGEFDDPTLLNTFYTPGEEDINNESVELTLTASPIDPCVTTKNDKVVVSFSPSVGISEMDENMIHLSISPNPSTGEFSIDLSLENKADLLVKLVNTGGDVIFTEKASKADSYNKTFNLQYLPKGVYFVQVETGSTSKTEKIVLQ